MYLRKDYPKKGDYVLATVKEISDISVKVILNEYENFVGLIPIDELSSKRISNVKEIVHEGKVVVCYVLDVDERGRVATLSLKRVDENRRRAKILEYKREKQAYFLLKKFCNENKIKEEEILNKILDKNKKIFEIFYETFIGGEKVLEKYNINKKIIKKLYSYIKENYNVPIYELRIKLGLYTLEGNGLFILKNFLEKIAENGFEVKYLGAPYYYIKYTSYNPKEISEKKKFLYEYIEKKAKENNLNYEIIEE